MNTGKRALILLDDLMFRVKIDSILRQAGFTGEYHSTSDGLLASYKRDPPTAVVIDLNQRGGRPLDLIAELKGSEQTSSVPVLAYVSHVQVELRDKANSLGCDKVVARSVLPESLLAFLEQTITPL